MSISNDPFRSPQEVSPPPRSRSLLWLLAAGVLAGMCCCGGLCVVPMSLGIYQAATQRDEVEQVITAFLVDMDAKRIDAALGHFSSRVIGTNEVSKDQLEQMANQPHFQGCQSAQVMQIKVGTSFNTNQSLPQGTVANISGTLTYKDGGSGAFRATLEKEQGTWRLHNIHVQRAGVESIEP